MTTAARRLVTRLRRVLADQIELHERRILLERPWEEQFLHWAVDADGVRRLHGHLAPPARGARRSVTRSGWCPATARATR